MSANLLGSIRREVDFSYTRGLAIKSTGVFKGRAFYRFRARNTLVCALICSNGKENESCRELHLCEGSVRLWGLHHASYTSSCNVVYYLKSYRTLRERQVARNGRL